MDKSNFRLDKDDIEIRVYDEESLIVQLSTGNFFKLNETATMIFEAISKKKDIDDLIKEISRKTNASEKEVKCDVDELISELLNEKIIKKHE